MKTNKENIIDIIRKKIKPENRQFVSKNLEISEQISRLLEKKGWSQKEFAKKLGKNESELSKWISGLHNLTLKSICLMEIVLEEDIITTPFKASEKYSKYIKLKICAMPEKSLGDISFSKIEYSKIYNKEIA